MKLEKKKELVARTLGIGKTRISFNNERLSEIKEAITNQDIRDLLSTGAIVIKPIKGRRKVEKRKYRRRAGKIKKTVVDGKGDYIIMTRKLRKYLANLRDKELISEERYNKLRQEIRASNFNNINQFKERILQS